MCTYFIPTLFEKIYWCKYWDERWNVLHKSFFLEFLKSLSAITSAANSLLVGRANPYTKESFLLFYLNLNLHKNQKLNIWTKFITDYMILISFFGLVYYRRLNTSESKTKFHSREMDCNIRNVCLLFVCPALVRPRCTLNISRKMNPLPLFPKI